MKHAQKPPDRRVWPVTRTVPLQIVYMGWCEAREQDALQDRVYLPTFLALRGSCLYKFLAPPVSVLSNILYFPHIITTEWHQFSNNKWYKAIHFENKIQKKKNRKPSKGFWKYLAKIYVLALNIYFITLEKPRSRFCLGIYDKQNTFIYKTQVCPDQIVVW